MSTEEKPHMVIGVDLGMTCTGVSYTNLTLGTVIPQVRWVQKWPGRLQANENKVPTVIVYPITTPECSDPVPSSWGFLSETSSEQTAEDKEYKEWFKTSLDPDKLRQKQREDLDSAPASLEEVEKWYEDYLRKIYEYLEFKLGPELVGIEFKDAKIEWIFSVPTTWPVIPTVENFRRIVCKSGFTKYRRHEVTIGLTEAEAAAVHVSTEAPGIFKERDILLVCDAGGGTTDLSVLRVTGAESQAITLEQLDVVFGETIGSAAIDYEFEKLVQMKLGEANEKSPLSIDPDDAAWEMMKSRDFQSVKCEYGSPDDTPMFSIAIPKAPQGYNVPDLQIKSGEMKFVREDLQKMFDKQITKLCKLIDTQLASIHQKHPNERVSHLVLSGGLGNSAYVQECLRSRYGNHFTVRIAPDPQLAVCKGMVADRIRKIQTNKSVLGWRCCRASYGTMCKILYDPKNPGHQGMMLTKDPLNNKLYITDAIAWFVKKGEPVSVDKPIVHTFVKKVPPGDPRRAFPTSIITTDLDLRFLPTQMCPETRVLCEIESDLSAADEKKFVEKNRRFWSIGKHYFKVEYQVKVIIGPADIRFELWFGGQKLSRDQSIKVEWMAAAPPPTEFTVPELPDPSVLVTVPDQSNDKFGIKTGKMNGNFGGLARLGKWPVYN